MNKPVSKTKGEGKQDNALVDEIHDIRPAVSVDDIKKAIDEVGPKEREVMDKLNEKDHK